MITKHLNSWEEIQTEFNQINPVRNNFGLGGYDRMKDFIIFRGHRQDNWLISSTLERKNLKDSLENIIFEFRQKLSLFDDVDQKDISTLEIFSLMRHFGVPSPLVDFTFSPYIALFFAFNSFLDDDFSGLNREKLEEKRERYQQSNCAIYALNHYVLNKLDSKIKEYNYEKYLHDSEVEFEDFFHSNKSGVRAFLPSIYNKRISSQQGLFLSLSKDNQRGFHDELLTSSEMINLTKYTIPQMLSPQILYELHKMNINSSTLFPDLDGLSAHVALKEKLRVLNMYLHFRSDLMEFK